MNNKSQVNVYITLLIFFIVLVIMFISYIVYKNYQVVNNDCLIEKAKSYCLNKNSIYDSITIAPYEFKPIFYCKEDLRVRESKQFYFLPSELEECGVR